MDQAFIQDAQDDVDGQDRRQRAGRACWRAISGTAGRCRRPRHERVIGTLILAIVSLDRLQRLAHRHAVGRLKEKVVATNGPWWLTDSGVVPGPKLVKADSGTMVSTEVETRGAGRGAAAGADGDRIELLVAQGVGIGVRRARGRAGAVPDDWPERGCCGRGGNAGRAAWRRRRRRWPRNCCRPRRRRLRRGGLGAADVAAEVET